MTLEIPILNSSNVYIGRLCAFSSSTFDDPEKIEMIRSWRQRYRQFFLTQFEETTERTRNWLKDTVLADPTRLMFFIYSVEDEKPIGHIGVLHLDYHLAELDNMIRGRDGGDKQLMYWSEIALLKWLFEVKNISGLYLRVLDNNWKTINLHSRAGFKKIKTFPLVRREVDGDIRFEVCTDAANTGEVLCDFGIQRMELTPENFFFCLRARVEKDILLDTIKSGMDAQVSDPRSPEIALQFLNDTARYKYSYRFSWMGRPIIQYPQDIVAMQELVWKVKPDLIIETGIAHGGSLIFYASMLELNALCGGPQEAEVVGIEINIFPKNQVAIGCHPMAKRISMIEGSSIEFYVIEWVRRKAAGKKSILVCLDSNHTHEHVLAELNLYAPLVSVGSYCLVFDTAIEDMPADSFPGRPWGVGNNPKTAVQEYLKDHPEFEVDTEIDRRLFVSCAPGGYLKRV